MLAVSLPVSNQMNQMIILMDDSHEIIANKTIGGTPMN